MGPNNNHLNSYQHSSALSVDNEPELDSTIDIGDVEVQSHPSLPKLHRRRHHGVNIPVMICASLLCFGVGLFAPDVFSSTASRGHVSAGSDCDVSTNIIPNLLWSDEFNGDSLDLTKWTFINGNGCDVGLCGWGNNELEWYTPSNTKVADGKLVIEARKFSTDGSPASYTSSKIMSKGKADFGVSDMDNHGDIIGEIDEPMSNHQKSRRYEASLRLPFGHGIWPAFWMLPSFGTYGGWPHSGEIDIMENIGKEGTNTVHGTVSVFVVHIFPIILLDLLCLSFFSHCTKVHYGLDWPQHQYAEAGITISSEQSSLNETYHTYSVERLPGIIRWYIDDIHYSTITKKEMKPYHWPFDEDFYFIFNMAVGGK